MKTFDPAEDMENIDEKRIPWAVRCRRCCNSLPQFLSDDQHLLVCKDCVDCFGKGVHPIPFEEVV